MRPAPTAGLARGRSRAALFVSVATPVLLATGCGDKEFEPPDRAEQVEQAEELLEAPSFDTIAWASDDARAFEGNGVFAAKCRNCHGPVGRGGTEYARRQGLDVPSLVEPEMGIPAELEAVRERVFTGHPEGMPTWGVAGITLREIDAVSFYVLESLRPEVLGR